MNDTSEILQALLEIKDDVGQIKSSQSSLRELAVNHAAQSAAAHTRITALEMDAARQRGARAVWNTVAVGVGTAVGYGVQALQTFIRAHH